MVRRIFCFAGVALALALAACQGSSGTGGLSIPAPAYNAPAGPGAPASSSRQQVLDGVVNLSADRTDIPLPALAGFAVSIALGTPPPATAASPLASASVAAAGARRTTQPAAPSPSPSVAPSAASAPAASAPVTAAAAAASTGSPAPAGDKVVTKTTIYPDDAPAAPSPKPSGDVVTFVKRTAIVRGYLEPATDLSLYGLGAIRFTIPASEQTSGRGFTIAVYAAGKKHHEPLLASDGAAVLADNVVTSSLTADALTLKKATGYLIMLYGDELPPTPAPAGAYPTPGNNPFPTQTPGGPTQPGYGQQPAYPQQPQPQQPGYPQPAPTATPFP